MRMRTYLRHRTRDIEVPDDARALAQLPYTVTVVYDDDDGYFVARSEEWPYLAGAEDTPGAAEATLREAIAIAIAGRMKRGFPISEPRAIHA